MWERASIALGEPTQRHFSSPCCVPLLRWLPLPKSGLEGARRWPSARPQDARQPRQGQAFCRHCQRVRLVAHPLHSTYTSPHTATMQVARVRQISSPQSALPCPPAAAASPGLPCSVCAEAGLTPSAPPCSHWLFFAGLRRLGPEAMPRHGRSPGRPATQRRRQGGPAPAGERACAAGPPEPCTQHPPLAIRASRHQSRPPLLLPAPVDAARCPITIEKRTRV